MVHWYSLQYGSKVQLLRCKTCVRRERERRENNIGVNAAQEVENLIYLPDYITNWLHERYGDNKNTTIQYIEYTNTPEEISCQAKTLVQCSRWGQTVVEYDGLTETILEFGLSTPYSNWYVLVDNQCNVM